MAAENGEAPEVNGTLLAIVLLFIPGIICYGIVSALAEKKERDNVTKFLQIFVYGVFSYVGLAFAHRAAPAVFPAIDALLTLRPSDINKLTIDPTVIAWAAVFGIGLGVIVTVNLNRQYLLKLCRKIRLTRRFGDEDVWTLLLNSTETDNYVTIRRIGDNLVYQGYVSGFSGGGETRELLIINVRVFALPDSREDTDTPPVGPPESPKLQQVGEIPFLYLSFKEDGITLEFGRKPDT